MTLRVAPEIKEKFPHIKIGYLIIKGAKNKGSHSEVMALLRDVEKEIRERYQLDKIGDVPKIKDWREAYRQFGFKPSEYRCSVESLTRRVLQGKELPDINPLVNLYNLVSLKHTLCAGSDDLDRVTGDIALSIADGSEPFHMIGSDKKEQALPGEVIYRDEQEVLCRAWNYRECEKSKITHETQNACLVLEGLEHTSQQELRAALKELKTLVETYCGGEIEEHIILGSHLPEYHFYDDFKKRKEKLDEIRKLGVDPYPPKFEPTHSVRDLLTKYEGDSVGTSEEAEQGQTPAITLAGRLMLYRSMGKNAFGHIQDASQKFQLMFNKELTAVNELPSGENAFAFIEKKLDLGDIIGVEGHLFRTGTGELTLFVKKVTLLCKTLLPLAHKWHGLTDKGMRYRKRWLDLISNSEVTETFRMRSQIVSIVRREMAKYQFLEVETPILQNIYGGAEARPFTTHLNALGQEMYLRIALEIALKKLIVGGINRVYEMGKVFRNEGIDRTHNPEFTMIEAYAAYWDYNDVRHFIEHIFETIALELFGSTQIGVRKDKLGKEHQIDLKRPWKTISMKDSILEYAGIDVEALSDDQMVQILQDKTDIAPADIEAAPRGKRIAMLFEELVEVHLIQPHHITDHPIETTPLCKLHRDPKERSQNIVERFETFILGGEFCNAYTELNDPELQRKLLELQAQMRDAGDDEANPMDEEFIEAICQGMPPTGGFGIGIDRMVMLFTGAYSIRDVLYFPLMRPEE